MKNIITLLTLFFVFTFFHSVSSAAQNGQDSIKSKIETIDGNEYIGVILEKTNEKIRLKTESLGEIVILVTNVRNISEIKIVKGKDGRLWTENPQATRYLWAPNGFNLKKGEGYYQNAWILFNQVVYGLSDHFSLGAGTVPLFIFAGTPSPVWLTAKVSVPVVENKFNLGAGLLAGTVVGVSSGSFGILYGVSTFGSRDQNLTVGLGWGFADGQMAKDPTINISGMIRTGPRGYLITENYFIGTSDNYMILLSLGGRRIINHVGLDFGAFVPIGKDIDTFFVVPWLGFTIPFGK